MKTRAAGKLRLERETLKTLFAETLVDVAGGTPVPQSTTCPPEQRGGGKLTEVLTRPMPQPQQVPGRITDVLNGPPRVGTCFCPPTDGR